MITLFIFLSLYVGLNIRYSVILGSIEAILLIGSVIYRFSKKIASICLLTLLLGVGISFIKFEFNKETYKSVVIEVSDNYVIVSSSLERFYVYEKNLSYEIGDIVSFTGTKKDLDFSVTESSFDFNEYLNKKGVYKQLVVTSSEVNFSNPFKIQKLKKRFLSHFDEDTSSVIRQLFFAKSDTGDTTSLLREMHLIRIASTSGLFLSLVYSLLTYIGNRILKKEKYADLIGTVFLLVYSVFTFPRFVVIKFTLLLVLKWINNYLLKRKFKYLDIVSVSGIFFMLIDRYLAYQNSFLLSYFLPIFILFINGSFRKMRKIKKKIVIILMINMAMIPFILNFNNEISPLSILLQIMLSPILIIYYFGIWLSFLGIPIYSLLNSYTGFLNKTLSFFLPVLFKINAPPLPGIGVLLYELIYIGVIYFISIRNIDLIKISLSFFIAIGALYFVPFDHLVYSTITFINVGQGDACLIQDKNTCVLIDTGGNIYHDLAKETLIPYFKKNRIYDIDLLITTHDDFDHSGAVSSLVENFKVKRYVKDYEYFPIEVGNLKIENYNVYPELWKEENDSSLVLGFTVKDTKVIVTGDATTKIEQEIIKDNLYLTCDILKVGHHGSKTSSSEDFIKTLQPKVGIISCGKNNKYGHPHKEVISILEKYHVQIRRTDLEGSIIYRFA